MAMAEKIKGKAVVGQSGGPTMVINQSLVGVVEEARKHPEITGILGARHGVRGIVEGNFLDFGTINQATLDAVAVTPSSALGSSRDKPDAEYCKRIFDNFKKNDVRYFFYIGGNDSADTARIVNDLAKDNKYDLHAFHVPKTIDNDLRVTDHCPGYGSAAKFVASAFMGDDQDNRALPGVKINVVMGRHAGFLTAASVLARTRAGEGPHLIYVPEVDFIEDKFLADVDAIMKKGGRCMIAVSEGVHDAQGNAITAKVASSSERDAHGNIQLSGTGALGDYLSGIIKAKLGVKRVRADTFGYLQRSFAGIYSKVDAAEARMVGRKAVEYSTQGISGCSVVMTRTGNGPKYGVEYSHTDIKNVARETKSLPREFINAEGNNILDSYKDYVLPLVDTLPTIGYLF
jgi:6-phosphofructokinase 1